jgi:hypothetical protein
MSIRAWLSAAAVMGAFAFGMPGAQAAPAGLAGVKDAAPASEALQQVNHRPGHHCYWRWGERRCYWAGYPRPGVYFGYAPRYRHWGHHRYSRGPWGHRYGDRHWR